MARPENDVSEKAVANRDVASVLKLYTPDASLLPPNAPLAKGTKAMDAIFSAYIEAGANSLTLDTIELEEQGDAFNRDLPAE